MNNSFAVLENYKETPFNNYSILRCLFKVGLDCFYNNDPYDSKIILLSLRAISTEAYQIGKPYIINRFGIMNLEIISDIWENLSLKNLKEQINQSNLWLNLDNKALHPPFMIKTMVLVWKIYEPYNKNKTPYSQNISEYKKIVENYGPSVEKLSISFSLLYNVVTYGLDLGIDFTRFEAIAHLELDPDWGQEEVDIYNLNFEHLLEHLVSVLPNPQLVQTFSINHVRRYSDSYKHWIDLPKKIFKSFSSLQNLYYTGGTSLYQDEALDFLNRDPRIQLFKCKSQNRCIYCCKCMHEYVLLYFDLTNGSHRKHFEALIKDVTNIATQIRIFCQASDDITLYKTYLLHVKWARLKQCTIIRFPIPTKGIRGMKYNFKVQPSLCGCVKI